MPKRCSRFYGFKRFKKGEEFESRDEEESDL